MSASGEVIIGSGIDLIRLERFRAAWDRHGQRLLERLFTADEQERCLRHADPVPEFAARFAAKEAAFKAIGTGWRQGVRWVDVEVRNSPSGRPFLRLRGRTAEIAREVGGRRVTVTLTHSRTTAGAQVLLLGEPGLAPWWEEDRIRGAAVNDGGRGRGPGARDRGPGEDRSESERR